MSDRPLSLYPEDDPSWGHPPSFESGNDLEEISELPLTDGQVEEQSDDEDSSTTVSDPCPHDPTFLCGTIPACQETNWVSRRLNVYCLKMGVISLEAYVENNKTKAAEESWALSVLAPNENFFLVLHSKYTVEVEPIRCETKCNQALKQGQSALAYQTRAQARRLTGYWLQSAEDEDKYKQLAPKGDSFQMGLLRLIQQSEDEIRNSNDDRIGVADPSGWMVLSSSSLSFSQTGPQSLCQIRQYYGRWEHQSRLGEGEWKPCSLDKDGCYPWANRSGQLNRSTIDLPPDLDWNGEWEIYCDPMHNCCTEGWSYSRTITSNECDSNCLSNYRYRKRYWRRRTINIENESIATLKNQLEQLVQLLPSDDVYVEERYENQAGDLYCIEGKVDRRTVHLPTRWEWDGDWRLMPEPGAGPEGWMYQTLSGYSPTPGWLGNSKRRKWARKRVRKIKSEDSPTNRNDVFGPESELDCLSAYYIVNKWTELAIKAPRTPNGILIQSVVKKREYQVFRLLPGRDGCVYIMSGLGRCLTEARNNTVEHRSLVFRRLQLWAMIPVYSGYYYIMSRWSGRCLSVGTNYKKHSAVSVLKLSGIQDACLWKFIRLGPETTFPSFNPLPFSLMPTRFPSTSLYMLSKLMVERKLTPIILETFPPCHIADLLVPLLNSCLEEEGVYGCDIATYLYEKAKSSVAVKSQWSLIRNRQPQLLDSIYKLTRSKCLCGSILCTPTCGSCGESRDIAFRIADPTSYVVAQLLGSLTEAHVGVSLPVDFQHPLYSDRHTSRLTIVKQFSSNAKPLLLKLEDEANGEQSHIIYKVGDDLMQDHLTLTFFALFNEIWRANGLEYEGEAVQAFQYRVACTGPIHGIIESVPNSKPLQELKWELQYSERLLATAAGAMAAGYVMGVCDRHKSNMLLSEDGTFFHIDFGHILGDRLTIDADILAIPAEFKTAFGSRYSHFELLCMTAYQQLLDHKIILQNALALYRLPHGRTLSLDVSSSEFFELVQRAPDRFKTQLKNIIHDYKFPTPPPSNSSLQNSINFGSGRWFRSSVSPKVCNKSES